MENGNGSLRRVLSSPAGGHLQGSISEKRKRTSLYKEVREYGTWPEQVVVLIRNCNECIGVVKENVPCGIKIRHV